MRLAVALARRIYFLFVANFHWTGTLALLYAWRNTALFRQRSWRIAWLLVAAYVAMLTGLGGAVLNRYLLPVLPVVFAAMAAALSFLRRGPRLTLSCLLLGGVAASNWINPPYPFPFEENLAFTDFLRLQSDAADYIAHWYPNAVVTSAWPMTAAVSEPDLGFVERAVAVRALPNLAPGTLRDLDWDGMQVLVAFSRDWDPRFNLLHLGPVRAFWRRFYGYAPEADARGDPRAGSAARGGALRGGGQWVDVYANGGAGGRGPGAGEARTPFVDEPGMPWAVPGPHGRIRLSFLHGCFLQRGGLRLMCCCAWRRGAYASDLLAAKSAETGFAGCGAGVGDCVRRAAVPGAARPSDCRPSPGRGGWMWRCGWRCGWGCTNCDTWSGSRRMRRWGNRWSW